LRCVRSPRPPAPVFGMRPSPRSSTSRSTRSPRSRKSGSWTSGGSARTTGGPRRRTSLRCPSSCPAFEPDVTPGQAGLDTGQQGIHLLGSGGHDRPELVPLDRFGDLAAGVADEPGDLLDGDVAVGHEADEGVPQLTRRPVRPNPSRPAHRPETTGARSRRRAPARRRC
jgi:hypothetical protein